MSDSHESRLAGREALAPDRALNPTVLRVMALAKDPGSRRPAG